MALPGMGKAALGVGAAALFLALGVSGTAEASTSTRYGCPSGAVCIYPQNQNPMVSPQVMFWSYGAHNLSNMYGDHWVLNNQYGGASVTMCYGYNGTNCDYTLGQDYGAYFDLTPYNSVVLWH